MALSTGISTGGFQEALTVDAEWIPSLGIRFHLAMDGISLFLVLLTTWLMPIVILSTFTAVEGRPVEDRPVEGHAVEGHAVVKVADGGPGVPHEARERVFERFVQLDPPARAGGGEGRREGRAVGRGVGLGLAICREIVEAHQGEVWVAGNRPAGSTFGFSLPLTD